MSREGHQKGGSASGSGSGSGLSYAAAGVDLDAGERVVDLLAGRVARASRPEVMGGVGGFAGLFRLDVDRWRHPVLASSTDGVGTKIAVAMALGRHDTVGIDLVAMVADDLVVCGAEPLFLQDYIACGQVVPEKIAEIVGGIAEGCRLAGCALVGGETAEHPGMMAPDHYDLAATGVGVVEADALLGAERVREGDVVLAMASSGLHSNGYSLVRHVLMGGGSSRMPLDAEPDELDGAVLGEVLLTPTRIYSLDCLALIVDAQVHAFSHVTGGGLASNLARVLPEHLDAVVERRTWTPPAIFGLVGTRGGVARTELERTFNMGVGMLAVVARGDVDLALAVLTARHVPAWVVGEVVPGSGEAQMVGDHPA